MLFKRMLFAAGALSLAAVFAFSQATRVQIGQLGAPVAPQSQILIINGGHVLYANLGSGFTLDNSGPVPVLNGGGVTFVETVSQPTGPTSIYNLADAPKPGSLEVFRNGVLYTIGVDYTLVGQQITLLTESIAQSGDVVKIRYAK